MYIEYNGKICIEAKYLYDEGKIISLGYYNKLKSNGYIKTARRGCKGTPSLIEFFSIELYWIREKIEKQFGDPYDYIHQNLLSDYIKPDYKAQQFYADYQLSDGRNLPHTAQKTYRANAEVLNAINTYITNLKGYRKARSGRTKIDWTKISKATNNLSDKKYPHNLPSNYRRLMRKYKSYIKNGLTDLIHKGYTNNNSRVVTVKIEDVLLSLACIPNKPYASSVRDMYLQFLGGSLDIVDIKTGEIFNREDFYNENGEPAVVSDATVWNYLKDPRNQLIINKVRNGSYDFSHKVRPHVHRTAPQYSMSKITLDDRDIMHTKLPDGSKVMAYYAFDVMSGAMIGISHSKSKNQELFLDCMRNMFRFTTSLGFGIPLELEVENHLVSDFKDGLMKAGNVFPMVRWCNPTNSQEKYAERLIGIKKYGVEKANNQNVGRHYSRRDSNRITRQKIFDEYNDNYKYAKASFEQIVANELQEQLAYNNQLHPNQKKYKGMTRLDVFKYYVNPQLPKFNKSLLAKYIGEHVVTSIRRSQYVTVQYGKYQLSSPEVLNLLKPNNYKVDAYYMPAENGTVSEVFIYQNDRFICECKPVDSFNRAKAEWTEKDAEAYINATKYISTFDKMVKDDTVKRLKKVAIIKPTEMVIDVTPEVLHEAPLEEAFEFEEIDDSSQRNRAIDAL